MHRVIEWTLLAGAVGLVSPATWAEMADRSRPIQVEADSVRVDDARRVAVYEGNVVLTQGTLNMLADRIDVHQDSKGMTAGEATGRPVRFRQKMDGRDEFMEARANRAEYDARVEKIKLIGNAFVSRGKEELRGGVIVYDMRTEHYQAQGVSEDGKQGRVHAVIQPRSDSADSGVAGDKP